MNNKTLVILSPGFASSESDTTCLPMQQHLVKTINEIAPHVNIIILAFQYPYQHGVYEWNGNVVFSFNGKNRGGIQRLMLRRKVHTVLKELNKRSSISGLLSFWYGECAVSGKNFSDHYNIPNYCWILGQDAKKENKYPRRLALKPDQLIALSDFLQDEFENNHGTRPSRVIMPGVDINSFDQENRTIDIMGIGSLIPLKRFDLFVEAVAELKKYFPGIKAVLAGDGPEKERLKSLITKKDLQSNIEMTGELSHPEVIQLLKRTRVLLHPSAYEGFSGVCQEALSCGAHVVSFTKAMKGVYQQWHIVLTMEEMISRAKELLENSTTLYQPSKDFSMKNTAREILDLYFPG